VWCGGFLPVSEDVASRHVAGKKRKETQKGNVTADEMLRLTREMIRK